VGAINNSRIQEIPKFQDSKIQGFRDSGIYELVNG
jgi:hypothetical protein